MVLVDGVRSANPTITLNTIPVSDIHQVEVLPPGEAGLQYGSGSQYGVILIETFTGRTFANAGIGGPQPGSGLYSWALETEPYPWVRNYGLAFVVNAAAMAAGYAIAQSCLSFDDLTAHFTESSCGTLGNTGSRLALYALPQFALGYAAERAGGTDLSRGNAWRNAVAAAIMSAPGVVLALTTEADGFSGSRAIGGTMFILGAPAAAVAADRLFRRVRR